MGYAYVAVSLFVQATLAALVTTVDPLPNTWMRLISHTVADSKLPKGAVPQ